ncbi:MAG: EamA family transporter [Chitinophagaceae bacterium]|nr:EamA family transporter [Chitinophagaceae bacterium]
MAGNESKVLVILAFGAIYILWGSTYVAIIFGLKSFPPFLLGSLRYLLAGGILYSWSAVNGERILRWDSIKKNTIVGILTLIGGSFTLVWTEQYLPSGPAAIIVAALPIWFVVLDRKQWQNYFSGIYVIAGILLGFIGILLLFGVSGKLKTEVLTGMQLLSAIIIMMGSVSFVIGSLYSKYHPSEGSNESKVSIQLLSSGALLLLVSFLRGELRHFSFSDVSLNSWLALLFLTIIGSVVTYNAYIWLLSKRAPVLVGTYAYVNPVVAVLLGTWLANENLKTHHIIALGCILIGVLLINLPKYSDLKQNKYAKY